ncbi:MAG: methyltransferase domain-containing protein [Hyphomicrobiales bacterium]
MGQAETDHWLEKVYRAPDRAALQAHYDIWAESYDADLQQVGYLHVPVMTGLVARHVTDKNAQILDAGAGTGGLGEVLAILGYTGLTGLDMSEGMLARARARGCYAALTQGVLGEPLAFADAAFDAIISTGTFTSGHAPASAFDELVRVLKPGGLLMFTVATSVWEAQGFAAKIRALMDADLLAEQEITPLYRPMPFSPTESGLTTWARAYRRTG